MFTPNLFSKTSPVRHLGALVASVSLSSISAFAATFYVAPTGNDSNPGAKAAPFKTIQRAAGIVKAGDTVIIKPGRYAPFSLSDKHGTVAAPITFFGEPGAVVDRFLGGPKSVLNIVISGGSYFTLDGLELTDSDTKAPAIGCVPQTDNSRFRQAIKIYAGSNGQLAHHITIKNMHIHHVRSHGILGKADYLQFINNHVHHNGGDDKGWTIQAYGTYLEGKGLLIRGNRIHHNNGNGIRLGNLAAHMLLDSVIENNLIHDNGGRFTHVNGNTGVCRIVDGGDGIVLWGGSGNIFRNNIVYNTRARGIRILEKVRVSNMPNAVYNNTVYKNGSAGIVAETTEHIIFKNNISYLNKGVNMGASSPAVLSNNLTVDPMFENAPGNNFRLKANSPARDKGADLRDWVKTDFDGTPRPSGGAFDIGAFEYGGSVAQRVPSAPSQVTAQ